MKSISVTEYLNYEAGIYYLHEIVYHAKWPNNLTSLPYGGWMLETAHFHDIVFILFYFNFFGLAGIVMFDSLKVLAFFKK